MDEIMSKISEIDGNHPDDHKDGIMGMNLFQLMSMISEWKLSEDEDIRRLLITDTS